MRTRHLDTILTVAGLAVSQAAWAQDAGIQAASDPAKSDAAATAHAQAQTAQSQAQIAAYQVQEEKIKAAQAAVPSSGLSNGATANANAGTAEANYLSASLIRQMADTVMSDTNVTCASGETFVLFSGTTAPDLSDWAAFDARYQSVLTAMILPFHETAAAGKTNDAADFDPDKKGKLFVAALALLPALLSFLNSNDTANGVTVTYQDSMLQADIAKRLLKSTGCKVKIANQIFDKDAGVQLGQKFALLNKYRQAVTNALAGSNADAAKGKIWDPNIVSELNTAAAIYDQFEADAFGVKGSDGKVTGGTYATSQILKEMAVADAIGKNGKGMFLTIQNASGGLYTRKNIATFFTANPFSISASATVTYSVINGGDETVVAADTIACIAPYRSLKVTGVLPPPCGEAD